MEKSRSNSLLITSNFYPEESGISIYSTDLAVNVLKGVGEVTVLTTLPHYPWWQIPEKFSHISPGKSEHNGVTTWRVSPYIPKKSSALGRARFELSFWYESKKLLKSLDLAQFDMVIAIMPTVTSGLLARVVSQRMRIPGFVILQDISSLGALQSGIPGGKLFYRIAKLLEVRATKWASRIVVVSEAMIPIISKYTESTVPIETIHNYSVLNPSRVTRSEARQSLNFDQDAFLLLHTGNIGYKQDLLNVVEAAKLLEGRSNIKIILVGHGNQEENVRTAMKSCKNIEWQTFFSAEDFPKALAAADVLLLNEISSLREMALPSKLTSYLSSGSPVLAALSPESATRSFLGDAAYIVSAGNPRLLADAILKLEADHNLRAQLSQIAFEFSEECLSSTAGRQKYINLINNMRDKR